MKTVAKVLFGSHLYGTSTPESDLDYKSIFIPHARDLIIGNAPNHFNRNTNNSSQKNSVTDVDHELYSLKYFFQLAKAGETVALDMIHAPDHMVETDLPAVWQFIHDNRSRFYTTDMKSYLGYVRKQAAKYGVKGSRLAALREVVDVIKDIPERMDQRESFNYQVKTREDLGKHIETNLRYKVKHILDKLPINEFAGFETTTDEKSGEQTFYVVLGRKFQSTITVQEMKRSLMKLWDEYGERARKAEANEGIDWKAVSHALRGGYQLLEIYKTGDLVMPLQKAHIIKQVKCGEWSFKDVQSLLEEVVDQVESKAEEARKNGMRKEVDMKFWDNFVEKVYLEAVKDYYKW